MQQLCTLITKRFPDQCGLVYCQTREHSESLALELKKAGIRSIFYHGGILDPIKKLTYTNGWLQGKFLVASCTNAFGKRIDKSDCRSVVHFVMPSSMESYVQEAERAGRDGDDEHCIILFKFEHRNFHLRNIANTVSEESRAKRQKSLDQFTEFILTKHSCRQQTIMRYFRTETDDTCDICNNCTGGVQLNQKDLTDISKVVINCVQHMSIFKKKNSVDELVLTLMGSQSADIRKYKFNQVPEYGYCKGKIKSKELTHLVRQLIVKGFLSETLRGVDERTKSSYLGVGQIRELLSGTVSVSCHM